MSFFSCVVLLFCLFLLPAKIGRREQYMKRRMDWQVAEAD